MEETPKEWPQEPPPPPQQPTETLETRVARIEQENRAIKKSIMSVAEQVTLRLHQLTEILGIKLAEMPDGNVGARAFVPEGNPEAAGFIAKLFVQVNDLKEKIGEGRRIITPQGGPVVPIR